MSDSEVIGDRQRYAEVGRQYHALEHAHELAREYRAAASNAAGARELIAEGEDDPEIREMQREADQRLEELEEEIRLAMVEPDPNDEKNVIVEVRAAPGGRRPACSRATSTGCSPATPSASGSRRSRCRSPTATTPLRSRAAALTASSSTRAARTACSGSRRP